MTIEDQTGCVSDEPSPHLVEVTDVPVGEPIENWEELYADSVLALAKHDRRQERVDRMVGLLLGKEASNFDRICKFVGAGGLAAIFCDAIKLF